MRVITSSFFLVLGITSLVRAEGPGSRRPFPGFTRLQSIGIRQGLNEVFNIEDGRFRFLSKQQMQFCHLTNACFGNNPDSPYGVVLLPKRNSDSVEDGKWMSIYRLEQNEVIMVIGKMPPAARYFGFSSYLFDRKDPLDSSKRFTYFASLTDALNSFRINLVNGGTAFSEQPVIFLTGADAAAIESVKEVLREQGIQRVNVDVLPSQLPLRMGLGSQQDTFLILMRMSGFSSSSKGEAFLENPTLNVLRLSPKVALASAPYSTPALINRTRGRTEEQDVPGLTAARDEIAFKLKSSGCKEMPVDPLSNVLGGGRYCIENHMECLGDTRDTSYTYILPAGTLPANDPRLFYIVGSMHHKTQRATYINLSFYWAEKVKGIGSFLDSRLEGSATQYLPANHPMANKLYVAKAGRNCENQPFCFEVSTSNLSGVPANQSLSFAVRAYVDPQTKVGPDPRELIPPRIFACTP